MATASTLVSEVCNYCNYFLRLSFVSLTLYLSTFSTFFKANLGGLIRDCFEAGGKIARLKPDGFMLET